MNLKFGKLNETEYFQLLNFANWFVNNSNDYTSEKLVNFRNTSIAFQYALELLLQNVEDLKNKNISLNTASIIVLSYKLKNHNAPSAKDLSNSLLLAVKQRIKKEKIYV